MPTEGYQLVKTDFGRIFQKNDKMPKYHAEMGPKCVLFARNARELAVNCANPLDSNYF